MNFKKYLYIYYIYIFFRGNVTLTDLPENLQQLKQNVDENIPSIKGTVKVAALKWGTAFRSEPFDFLIMADCIYYPEVRLFLI
jgi:hypothetical protein